MSLLKLTGRLKTDRFRINKGKKWQHTARSLYNGVETGYAQKTVINKIRPVFTNRISVFNRDSSLRRTLILLFTSVLLHHKRQQLLP